MGADSPNRERLIVVGNGMAGLRFLEELQTHASGKFDATVIGAEPDPAYNRVLLSSVLAGEAGREDIEFKPRSWYAENGMTLRTGVLATAINREAKTITLSDGETLSYDKLLLATGSQPIVIPFPGHDLENVLTFRNLKDVNTLQATPKGAGAVVIGGGLLGLETAYGLKKIGADVTLVHLMDKLMERQLDSEAAALLKAQIESQGIKVLLQADTEAIEGDKSVKSVRLKDGRVIPAELVVMAVGIRPETSLAKEASLETGRGIIVNDAMATSDASIYALGECAEHGGIAYGLVEPLYAQAEVLAKRLGGDTGPLYKGSSISTNLKVSGIEIFSAGAFEDVPEGERIYFRDPAKGIYKKLQVVRSAEGDEYLVGAVLVGDREDGPWYAGLIASETPINNMRDTLMFGRDLAERAA